MTMTTANVAYYMLPLGMEFKVKPGEIFDTKDIKKKKKKKVVGVVEFVEADGVKFLTEKKEIRYEVNGKKGVWRTISGRHYFFPDDKSGIFPPLHSKKGE